MNNLPEHSTTPKWRKDFPIQWGMDNYITRRDFTKFLVMISGATALGNGYFVWKSREERKESYPTLEVARVEEMQPGSVKLFRYPDKNEPAILLRLADGNFAAYKQRCTHLSCPVHFAAGEGKLLCPCHHGEFDAATGAVLAGPPPRPLPRITLEIADGRVLAKGVQGS